MISVISVMALKRDKEYLWVKWLSAFPEHWTHKANNYGVCVNIFRYNIHIEGTQQYLYNWFSILCRTSNFVSLPSADNFIFLFIWIIGRGLDNKNIIQTRLPYPSDKILFCIVNLQAITETQMDFSPQEYWARGNCLNVHWLLLVVVGGIFTQSVKLFIEFEALLCYVRPYQCSKKSPQFSAISAFQSLANFIHLKKLILCIPKTQTH